MAFCFAARWGREVLTTFPLETSAGWLLVQRRMLDESSLGLDFFLWFDLSFFFWACWPSCFFVVFGVSTLSFSGFWVSPVVVSFSGGSVSHGSLVCFFFGNRESRIALSQLAMRGSGWALDTGIVFSLQSSSRQLQLHSNRSGTEHCVNYSTDT